MEKAAPELLEGVGKGSKMKGLIFIGMAFVGMGFVVALALLLEFIFPGFFN
jgi:hypothetical protein